MTLPDRSTPPRALRVIAGEIQRDWGDQVYFGAKPYLRAMASLEKVTDKYGQDDADDIVQRFLLNARSWRGETARRVKAELKALIK